ncbi:MAG: DUF6051 family protein [Deltaproteobacteria bacterium]|jgi:hypothetical protein|nr:DUF6051 family protein [Deltaproteobacteria bacterium]
MRYNELHEYLKKRIDFEPEVIELPELSQRVRNHRFGSVAHKLLQSVETPLFDPLPDKSGVTDSDSDAARETYAITKVPDHRIPENKDFAFHALQPNEGDADRVIILLHGFNERNWGKYLPWASLLAEGTGAAVAMFPIAFHMNRSPSAWNDPHLMRSVSQLRKKAFPRVQQSTLSNAAISVRMSENPARFFWSGLQSFHDVGELGRLIRKGAFPGIKKDARIDFFTYSIGTLLGEIVLMTDEDGLFRDSRMVAFCGGPVFNRLSPVSKFILDSEASVALYSYLVEHLTSHIKENQNLASYLSGDSVKVGMNIRSFLNYRLDRGYREDKLRDLSERIYALCLAKDEVVPYFEVINTLKGAARDIDIRVDVEDFPFPYRHEDPFPVGTKNADAIDAAFRKVFASSIEFLR